MTACSTQTARSAAGLDDAMRRLAELRRRARGGLWCGGAGGGIPASSNLLDHGATGLLPVAFALLALIGAFVWMLRRWGARPPALPAEAPAAPPAAPRRSRSAARGMHEPRPLPALLQA